MGCLTPQELASGVLAPPSMERLMSQLLTPGSFFSLASSGFGQDNDQTLKRPLAPKLSCSSGTGYHSPHPHPPLNLHASSPDRQETHPGEKVSLAWSVTRLGCYGVPHGTFMNISLPNLQGTYSKSLVGGGGLWKNETSNLGL